MNLILVVNFAPRWLCVTMGTTGNPAGLQPGPSIGKHVTLLTHVANRGTAYCELTKVTPYEFIIIVLKLL
jgi:hypothetical protein